MEAVFSLEKSPHRCPTAPESAFLGREIKHLLYGKQNQTYRVFFEIFDEEKVVRIYRIRHTSRDSLSHEDFATGSPFEE